MKEHLHLEESALYSCQTINALCSCGDQTNQHLLRQAGVCDLVGSILKASVPLSVSLTSSASVGPEILDTKTNLNINKNTNTDPNKKINLRASYHATTESTKGIFSQMFSKARSYSYPIKPVVPNDVGSVPLGANSNSTSASTQAALSTFRVGFGLDWKNKLRVSLAAIRAISCLSCSIDFIDNSNQNITDNNNNNNNDNDNNNNNNNNDRKKDINDKKSKDDISSNSITKANFGESGVIEIMIGIGNGVLSTEGRDKDPSTSLAVLQWISLALCYLIDPRNNSDNRYNNNNNNNSINDNNDNGYDSENDDLNFEPNVKKININLNRLCFCNRSGDFLVNVVLSCTSSNSGIISGDVDALVYNALSVMVSMCEDKVGNHKILSSENITKMLLQCIGRYSVTVSDSIGIWMSLLCLSLLSSAALNPLLAEKLVLGGVCRHLSSALVSDLLPAAMKAIQQPSRDTLAQVRPSRRHSVSIIPSDNSNSEQKINNTNVNANVNDIVNEGTREVTREGTREVTRECGHGSGDRSGNKNEDDDRECDDNDGLQALPTIIVPSREKSSAEAILPPQSLSQPDLMKIPRSDYGSVTFFSSSQQFGSPASSTGAIGIPSLRVTAAVRDVIISATASPVREEDECEFDAENNQLLAIVMAREACNALTELLAFTNVPEVLLSDRSLKDSSSVAVPIRKMSSFSNPVSIYRENSGSLIGMLSTLFLVADASLLLLSVPNNNKNNNVNHDDNNDNDNDNSGSAEDRVENIPPSSILLPAVRELKQMAQKTVHVMQLQQHQKRNVL